MSTSSPEAAAIFCRWSISSTVVSRSRSAAASSNRISSAAVLNALAQFARQRAMLAFQKQPHLAHGLRIGFGRGQPFHARPQSSDECGTADRASDDSGVRSTLQEGTRKCR